jgi:hypothetical protein
VHRATTTAVEMAAPVLEIMDGGLPADDLCWTALAQANVGPTAGVFVCQESIHEYKSILLTSCVIESNVLRSNLDTLCSFLSHRFVM